MPKTASVKSLIWQEPVKITERGPYFSKRRRDTPEEHKHSEAEWLAQRQKIEDLYGVNELSDVARIMAEEDGFHASIAQYRHHIKKWKTSWKYLRLSIKQVAYIKTKVAERINLGKSRMGARLNGRNIPPSKLQSVLLKIFKDDATETSELLLENASAEDCGPEQMAAIVTLVPATTKAEVQIPPTVFEKFPDAGNIDAINPLMEEASAVISKQILDQPIDDSKEEGFAEQAQEEHLSHPNRPWLDPNSLPSSRLPNSNDTLQSSAGLAILEVPPIGISALPGKSPGVCLPLTWQTLISRLPNAAPSDITNVPEASRDSWREHINTPSPGGISIYTPTTATTGVPTPDSGNAVRPSRRVTGSVIGATAPGSAPPQKHRLRPTRISEPRESPRSAPPPSRHRIPNPRDGPGSVPSPSGHVLSRSTPNRPRWAPESNSWAPMILKLMETISTKKDLSEGEPQGMENVQGTSQEQQLAIDSIFKRACSLLDEVHRHKRTEGCIIDLISRIDKFNLPFNIMKTVAYLETVANLSSWRCSEECVPPYQSTYASLSINGLLQRLLAWKCELLHELEELCFGKLWRIHKYHMSQRSWEHDGENQDSPKRLLTVFEYQYFFPKGTGSNVMMVPRTVLSAVLMDVGGKYMGRGWYFEGHSAYSDRDSTRLRLQPSTIVNCYNSNCEEKLFTLQSSFGEIDGYTSPVIRSIFVYQVDGIIEHWLSTIIKVKQMSHQYGPSSYARFLVPENCKCFDHSICYNDIFKTDENGLGQVGGLTLSNDGCYLLSVRLGATNSTQQGDQECMHDTDGGRASENSPGPLEDVDMLSVGDILEDRLWKEDTPAAPAT